MFLGCNHPLIPVVAIPLTKYFCKEKNKMNAGMSESTDIANIGPQEDMPEASKNSLSPMGTVYLSGLVK